jgi:hypothetical protein
MTFCVDRMMAIGVNESRKFSNLFTDLIENTRITISACHLELRDVAFIYNSVQINNQR